MIILDASYTWNHTASVFLCLTYYFWHNVCHVHLCCSMSQRYLPFKVRCTDIYLVCPFIHRRRGHRSWDQEERGYCREKKINSHPPLLCSSVQDRVRMTPGDTSEGDPLIKWAKSTFFLGPQPFFFCGLNNALRSLLALPCLVLFYSHGVGHPGSRSDSYWKKLEALLESKHHIQTSQPDASQASVVIAWKIQHFARAMIPKLIYYNRPGKPDEVMDPLLRKPLRCPPHIKYCLFKTAYPLGSTNNHILIGDHTWFFVPVSCNIYFMRPWINFSPSLA